MDVLRGEYVSRLERIRVAMANEGLDALLVYSWKRGQVRYVSGYTPNYVANVAMLVVTLQGDPTMFIRFPFDLGRARDKCWFSDVRASGDVAAIGRDTASRLRELRLDRSRIGLASGDRVMDELPYTLYQQLRDDLPDAVFSDARAMMMGLRLIKSPAEIALLKRSANLADAAMAAAGEALRPWVSEYAVVAAAESAARAGGADGYLVVISGQGKSDLIGPPEDKAIQPKRMVIIEAGVQVGGYWTQVARVFVAGEPTAEQQAIYRAVHSAYRAAAAIAYPGKPLAEIAQAAHSVLDTAGYAGYVEQDMGHGIGLDLPEPPHIGLGVTDTAKVGMVLVIHPAVRVPGAGGAFVGGTVLVGEEGPMPLHNIPERL